MSASVLYLPDIHRFGSLRFGPHARGAGAPSPYVPLIIFIGESNSGGAADNADATAGELAPHSRVKILNNTGLVFEDLDVGTNNLIDHFGFVDNSAHSWEIGLANQVEAGDFGSGTVYLVKAGQGGSQVVQWAAAGTYYTKFAARYAAAVSAIEALGKTPLPIFWMSIGINDSLVGTTDDTFRSQMLDFIARLRITTGVAPVIMTKYTPSHSAYEANIDYLVANTVWTYAVDTASANSHLEDVNHWDYTGQKILAEAFKDICVDASKIGLDADYLASKAVHDGATAASGTVWDASAKGTKINLWSQRRDAVATDSSFTSVRASNGKSSGKWYCEIVAKTAVGNAFFVGLMDNSTAGGSGLDAYNPTRSGMVRDDGFAAANGFTNAGSGGLGSVAAGDVFGLHIDADNKKLFLSKNGSYLNSADPVAGTGAYFTWSHSSPVFPAVSLQQTQGRARLITSGFDYSPASGYSSYD